MNQSPLVFYQGRLSELTLPSTLKITTTYNKSGAESTDNRAGELVKKTTNKKGGLTQSSENFYYGESKHFSLQSQTNSNGLSVSYGANDLGEMTSRTVSGSGQVSESYLYKDGLLDRVNHSNGTIVNYYYYSDELAWIVNNDSSLEGQLYATETVHPDGQISKLITPKNIYGRTLSTVSPKGATTSYTSEGWAPVTEISQPPILEDNPSSISSTTFNLTDEGWVNEITRKIAVPQEGSYDLDYVNFVHQTEVISQVLDGLGRVISSDRNVGNDQRYTSNRYEGFLLKSSLSDELS